MTLMIVMDRVPALLLSASAITPAFGTRTAPHAITSGSVGGIRGATNFKDTFFGPESARTHIPDDEIAGDHLVDYSHEAPPVFLGHYWMEGDPAPLARNIACLDYSVAKPGGRLTAYRWDGEQVLETERFVWVDRVEGGN